MTKNTERLSPDRQLSRQDIECLKEAFKLFDCDRDGEITVEELGKVIRWVRHQPRLLEIKQIYFVYVSCWLPLFVYCICIGVSWQCSRVVSQNNIIQQLTLKHWELFLLLFVKISFTKMLEKCCVHYSENRILCLKPWIGNPAVTINLYVLIPTHTCN